MCLFICFAYIICIIYTWHGTVSYTPVSLATSWPSTWKLTAGCGLIKREILRKGNKGHQEAQRKGRKPVLSLFSLLSINNL